jgi:phosphoribosylformylglycinamidine cyclo-ligase
MEVLKKYRSSVHGMVHVTGGGFYENVPRMFPVAAEGKKQLIAMIKNNSWEVPSIFDELVRRGADPKNVYATFNMGIGFVLAVSKKDAPEILKMFNKNAKKYHKAGIPDMKAYEIGYVGHSEKAIKGELKGSREMTKFYD